ncbi:MAG: hypothetical protein N3A61_05380, partial [Ignavibacteria bacterium]|nr:hypothetical protein [Ignavibacteria bacterium]
MNRNTKIKFTIATLIVLCLSANYIYSQSSSVDIKRKTEIQAVKEYFEMMKSKMQTQIDNTSIQGKNYKFTSENKLSKTTAYKDRKHYFMNGNSIKTEIYNYGGIAPGYNLLRNVNNGVWKKLGYIFQFSPFAAASVPDSRDTTKRLHIVSDGLNDYPSLIEVNPNNRDSLWLWSPIP